MLDFPNNPADGDVHTEKGSQWVYLDPPGCWSVVASGSGTAAQEFHDPTGVASWRIIGDTLECWGSVTTDGSGGGSVTFPKTFNGGLAVNVTPDTQSVVDLAARLDGISSTGFGVFSFKSSTTAASGSAIVRWHAIGKWDGIS